MGTRLERKLNGLQRTDEVNPQTLLKEFKDKTIDCTRRRAQIAIPKVEIKMHKLQVQLDLLMATGDVDTNEETCLSIALVREQIDELECERYHDAHVATTMKYLEEGETVSKYWSAINRERRPRDIIYALETIEDTTTQNQEPTYVRRSD